MNQIFSFAKRNFENLKPLLIHRRSIYSIFYVIIHKINLKFILLNKAFDAFSFTLFLVCVDVLPACLWIMCLPGANGCQKKTTDAFKLELQL